MVMAIGMEGFVDSSKFKNEFAEFFVVLIFIYICAVGIGSIIRGNGRCDSPKLNIEKLVYTRAFCEAEVR